MRSLSLHYATIQIASIAGESRRVKVSGLAKARLLWLFRNFSILEFPVLNRQQQQLIDRMWSSGRLVPSKEAPRDVIGKIEAFSPKPCEQQLTTTPVRRASTEQSPTHPSAGKQASAEQVSGDQPAGKLSEKFFSEKLCSEKAGQLRVRFPLLRAGLRGAATWRAFTILLLGAAMYFGPRYLSPKHSRAPQTQVAAVDDEKQRTRSVPAAPEAAPPARSSAQALAAKSAAPIAAMPANVAVAAPGAAPMVARVLPRVTPPASSPADSAKGPKAVPAVVARILPEAMAHEASMPQAAPPQPRSVAGSRPLEVLIRVSVNAAGRAQSFEVLRGDQERQSAALKAARLWNFKPCAGGQACDQVLKFTDYGDSHRVQRIE